MPKFRKKPVVIEARKLTNDSVFDIISWCNEGLHPQAQAIAMHSLGGITIRTLEGDHYANFGDFIIKGVHGEFYPCKPDIFEKTYEPVTE